MNYLIIFLVSFGASTILPISSEATLCYYKIVGSNTLLLLLFAGIGNTLGSTLNYYIGKKGSSWLIEHKKISKERLLKSQKIFKKWGGFSLLLSWAPIIGDPITLIAGVFNYNLKKFLLIVAIAKFGRYIVVLWLC